MTNLLYSQENFNMHNYPGESDTVKEVEETKMTFQQNNEAFPDGYRSTSEMLALVALEQNSTKILKQAVSDNYKAVSKLASPEGLKPAKRKKSMKALMQQSFFHGANWIGYNFIA